MNHVFMGDFFTHRLLIELQRVIYGFTLNENVFEVTTFYCGFTILLMPSKAYCLLPRVTKKFDYLLSITFF